MRFIIPLLVMAAATALGSAIVTLGPDFWPHEDDSIGRSSPENSGLGLVSDRASLDGVALGSDHRVAAMRTSSATDVIPDQGDGVMMWADARLEMRADFELADHDFEDVDESIRSFSSDAGHFRQLTGRLTVAVDASPEWEKIWTSPTGQQLDDLQKEDMTQLVRDAAPTLVEASLQAQQLLQMSLYDYWESDRGFKYLESQGNARPEGFFHPKGGHYNICFEALAGGWKIAVNFDSSEYELLESQLREAFRQKTELYNALVTVANSR